MYAELDLGVVSDKYSEGNPAIETIYNEIKWYHSSDAELEQYDYYLIGDLHLLTPPPSDSTNNGSDSGGGTTGGNGGGGNGSSHGGGGAWSGTIPPCPLAEVC